MKLKSIQTWILLGVIVVSFMLTAAYASEKPNIDRLAEVGLRFTRVSASLSKVI